MHHMIPPEHCAEFRPVQHRHQGDIPPALQPAPFRDTSIDSLYQQPGPAGLQPLPHLLKAADGLPGPAGETHLVAQATTKTKLDTSAKIRGRYDQAARCLGECTATLRAF
jgi:hypothetical protein